MLLGKNNTLNPVGSERSCVTSNSKIVFRILLPRNRSPWVDWKGHLWDSRRRVWITDLEGHVGETTNRGDKNCGDLSNLNDSQMLHVGLKMDTSV